MVTKLHLEEWEMLCNKCNGSGDDPFSNTFTTTCPKCRGAGKVDWLENILGKKRILRGTFSYDDTAYMKIPNEIMDEMGKRIAEDIDKEILESILQSAEQTNKIMKISKTIMCEMEDKS
jgi:RecJ-like exonuclease